MPRRYPSEFRRRVLDLLAAGRSVGKVAAELRISEQAIYGGSAVFGMRRCQDAAIAPPLLRVSCAGPLAQRRAERRRCVLLTAAIDNAVVGETDHVRLDFTEGRGWSLERYVAWTTDALCSLLLENS